MAIQSQAIPINFSGGLDTKTDPLQIEVGQYLALENSVFTKGKRLTKRNGYGALSPLPKASSFATTFNGDLTAIKSNIQAYSTSNNKWIQKGNIQPVSLDVLPLIRNNLNQTQSDSVVAPNGLVCTAYTETNGTTNSYKYAVADSVTGQNIIAPTSLVSADATYGTPKVYLINKYFIIIYTTKVSAVYHLSFIAVSLSDPTIATAHADVSAAYTPSTTVSFDAAPFNGYLYVAYNGASASGVKMVTISPTLLLSSSVVVDGSHVATIMSVSADSHNGTVWAHYYDLATTTGYSVAVFPNLVVRSHFPTKTINGGTYLNITSVASFGVTDLFLEKSNSASGVQCNIIQAFQIVESTGVVSGQRNVIRSAGLASKAFYVGSVIYLLAAYKSTYQSTYFLLNAVMSDETAPVVIAKIAYENGGGYLTTGLPNVSVSGTTAIISYLFKDLVEALSNVDAAGTTVTGGVYSQLGVNMVSFDLTSDGLFTSEIGTNLNITGGFLWAYDGYSLVEQGFHLWPDSVQAAGSVTVGNLTAQRYYYMVTYEWTDNQGNAFRSAPSIPVTVDLVTNDSIDLIIPTLRITAKTDNPVKIVIYRWSVAQPLFYQVTSIAAPLLNSTASDTVTYNDKLSDTAILGNNILYTTGGVIENIGPPATSTVTLFDDRLWLVDAEDKNLLWFSKQVIESTPVEMSDLLTIYVAPSIGATGPTGPISATSAMDDKLVIFKKTACYYINGAGPDNTGSNNQYSQPIFITSMVGCSNQRSIVFQPQGLMFEFASETGNQIWILGRDLSTTYIGAPVEELTKGATILSAIAVPGTNEVRFNMSSGITIKYDYFFDKWGTHSTNAVSSTLYQGLHTYIDPYGSVFQETPGKYLDGTNPVLLSFTTGWIQLSGISGYQRIWEIQLLGQYSSPHLLDVRLGYNFAPLSEQATISPTNFTGVFGSDDLYGQTTPFGGPGDLEQWRIQPATQKCQAFQLSLKEVYDPSLGTAAGEGFTLSAFTCLIGVQRGYRPVKAANTVGTS